jgi:DNA-binding transcriptional ArsR family regulator
MAVDQLSSVFMALADPTRRAILTRLMAGDANVSELAEPFSISQPAISKHLKVLERAGLISRTRAATARLSHLEAAPMKEATMWMENYRHYWDSSFDRLDAALDEYMRGKDAQRGGARRTGLKRVGGKGAGQ